MQYSLTYDIIEDVESTFCFLSVRTSEHTFCIGFIKRVMSLAGVTVAIAVLSHTSLAPIFSLHVPHALADCTISVGNFAFFSTGVGTKVYVNNYGSNSVSVINTVTDAVTATISVGTSPYMSVSAGTKLYVVNYGSSNVSVIDTTTNTVSTTVAVGSNPYWATLVGTKLYVSNYGGGTVSVIDTSTDTVSTTIAGVSTAYVSTAIGTKLYVSKYGGTSVAVIDTTTDTLSTSITVGTTPYSSVAVGTKLYVGNYNSSNVSVIDSATDTVSATIAVGSRPYDLKAIGTKVYVTNAFSDTVSVINSSLDTVSSTISVGDSPYFMSTSGTKVYVSNFLSGTLSVIDSATDTVATTITLMTPAVSDPYSTTIVGTKLYSQRINTNVVGVVDTTTDTLISSCGATATGTPDMTSATDTGSSNTDNLTSDTTPDFTISCLAGATVQLREDTTTLAAGLCPAEGSITLTSSTLSEGNHTITARQDTGGGMGPTSSGLSITIDTTAPSTPGVPDLTTATDTGTSSTDNNTADATPNLTVTCTGTNTVTLTYNSTTIGTGTCSGGTVTITTSSLADGTYAVFATETDTAGNVSSASATLSIVITTAAPSIVSQSPTGNTVGLDGNTNLTITFSQAVYPVSGNVTIKKVSDNSLVEAIDITSLLVTGGGTTTLTINPSVTLSLDVGYYVLIDETALENIAGVDGGGITSPSTWVFTLVSPVVTSSSSGGSGGGGGGGGGNGGSRSSNEEIIKQLSTGNWRGQNWKEVTANTSSKPQTEQRTEVQPLPSPSFACREHITIESASVKEFVDIPHYWFSGYAKDAARLGIFTENNDLRFRPFSTVTADEFATILHKMLEPNKEIPQVRNNIISLFLKGKGDERITRATAVATLMKVFCVTKSASAEIFNDVRITDRFGPDIYAGVTAEIVRGYAREDGSLTGLFEPTSFITRDELATMIVRLVNSLEKK